MEMSPLRCLFLLGLLAVACDAPDADLAVELVRVHRDRVVLRAKTSPGLYVNTWEAIDRATLVGDNGTVELTLTVDEGSYNAIPHEWHAGRIGVFVLAEGVLGADAPIEALGDQVVARQTLELGFDLGALQYAPKDPDGSWVQLIPSKDDAEPEVECLRMRPKTSLEGRVPSIGSGLVSTEGAFFFGPPGTRVSLGPDTLELDDTGLARWQPDVAALLPVLPAQLQYAALPVTVHSPDLEPLKTELSVDLSTGCSRALGQHIASLAAEQKPLAAGVEPSEDLSIVAHASGALEVEGTAYVPVDGGKRTKSKPLAAARFLFAETETGREVGPTCSTTFEVPSDEYADMVELHSSSFEPTFVDAKMVMYRLPDYTELASIEVKAPRDRCDRIVYPRVDPAWIHEQIEAHATKRGKGRKRG